MYCGICAESRIQGLKSTINIKQNVVFHSLAFFLFFLFIFSINSSLWTKVSFAIKFTSTENLKCEVCFTFYFSCSGSNRTRRLSSSGWSTWVTSSSSSPPHSTLSYSACRSESHFLLIQHSHTLPAGQWVTSSSSNTLILCLQVSASLPPHCHCGGGRGWPNKTDFCLTYNLLISFPHF